MKLFETLETMQRFNKLVEFGHTGTPEEFANRLGISRSTVYEIIGILRSYDIEIAYSRTLRSFYYTSPVEIDIRFSIKSVKELSHNEMRNMHGGANNLFRPIFRTEGCYF